MTLRDLHADWAWVVIFSNGLVGVWAVGAHWLAPLRLRALWWCVIAAELTIGVQVGLGTWLMAVQHLKPPSLHALYGFSTLAFIAIFYAYRTQMRAQLYLLYGLGSLFLMGIGIRAVIIG